jgi:hypothetical protein
MMSAGVSLMTKIEAVRNAQQTKEQVSAPEKHQAGKKVGRKQRAPAVPHHVVQQEIEKRRQQERGIGYER